MAAEQVDVVVAAESVVDASPADVWPVITTFRGVNDELMPLCRMRPPRSLRGRTLDSWQPGERAACWLLAGGVVPFDRHMLGLESVTDGVGFVEESTTWLQRRWRHERTLATEAGGTRITDRVTIEPRIALSRGLTRWAVRRVFRHRHRRLARRFGVGQGPTTGEGPRSAAPA